MESFVAGYRTLADRGELARRIEGLYALMSPCRLCPRECGALRRGGETGACRAGAVMRIARAIAHFGEEPPISGVRGSGTVFFSHCNLRCCYCQNYQISQQDIGRDTSIAELARLMLALQHQGCHNISLVSASHFLPLIVESLHSAAKQGLHLPVVYNSNGYESPAVLRLLEGIVSVYLPDAKYGDDAAAHTYSAACDYTGVNRAALQEMLRQVGHLELSAEGFAVRGLLVRHLVLPHNCAATERVLADIQQHLGRVTAISLMAQYAPCYQAHSFAELSRRLFPEEYERSVEAFHRHGFDNGWIQQLERLDETFLPDFNKTDRWN